ncbi:MAG TPA: permease prefix domain 2-containing transporter [Gemmatimonadaceae bacterium]|nr:permease prefix domain 2-containing transporter [Gemmatimonadaceae bacterium]
MMDVAEPLLQPPRLARGLLRFALPCDPIRDAILGDLHEEFLDDAMERGARTARARYARRTAGIVIRAIADAMIWREWVSTGPAAGPQLVTGSVRGTGQRRASAAGGFAGFLVVALVVLVVAVVVNTVLFSATASRHTHASSAAGIGGVVLLIGCVGVGAVVVCAGPRWRRNRSKS